MKLFKRAAVLFLAVLMLLGLTVSASAASVPSVSSSTYIKAYTIASSGRVSVYTNSALTQRSSSEYIDAASDECYITGSDSSHNSLKVSYPTSNGRKIRYVPASAFMSVTVSTSLSTTRAASQITTYKWASGSSTYGYVSAGDTVYKLGTSGSRTRVLYSIGNGLYKLAWVNTSSLNTTTAAVAASSWQYPMTNAYCTWRSYSNMSWASYTSNSSGRCYHLGLDIYGTGGTVYAAASGIVVACSSSASGANGRYIIIQHTVNGKTVYSFYAHLASLNVSNGQTVSKGSLIGYAGGSGYGSNSYYGRHLHFAVVDTLWTGGGYYGYSTYFTGNKTTYGGVTYYNPMYLVTYNRLP